MDELNVSYDALRSRYGINFLFDTVTGIDPVARTVRTAGKQSLTYDRLVVSPGIQLLYESYAGYSEKVAQTARALRLDSRGANRVAGQTVARNAPRWHLRARRAAQSLPLPARALRTRCAHDRVVQQAQPESQGHHRRSERQLRHRPDHDAGLEPTLQLQPARRLRAEDAGPGRHSAAPWHQHVELGCAAKTEVARSRSMPKTCASRPKPKSFRPT